MLVIIAFAKNTSKKLPKYICKNFKHCAPIILNKNKTMIMYQFVKFGNIKKICLKERDLQTLKRFEWDFIYLKNIKLNEIKHPLTCVQMVKQMLGIHAPFVQTPDALYDLFCSN